MDKLERLSYWKSVAVESARAARRDGVDQMEAAVWKTEDDLVSFFDCFRPDGAGLEKVFAGVVGGDEIIQRLRRVYELKQSSSAWGYFIVRRPASITAQGLVDLTGQHLDKVRQIARALCDAKLVSLLKVLPQIKIMREAVPQRFATDFVHMPEAIVGDVISDWFVGLKPIESDALLMGEAFYSIACDYCIADYLMWPLYRHSTDIDDPFAPYFELWTHGARPWFEKPGLVNVYVTGDN